MPNESAKPNLQEMMDNAVQCILDVIHHPDFRAIYAGRQDIHEKREVKYGNKAAMVDLPMVPLIYQLWRANYDTIGSCQEWEASRGWAYVQFLSPEWGGTLFLNTLLQHGFDCQQKEEPMPINLTKGGIKLGDFTAHTLHVYFPTTQIPRIAETMKALLDKQGFPP
jgi:hypothetical protein